MTFESLEDFRHNVDEIKVTPRDIKKLYKEYSQKPLKKYAINTPYLVIKNIGNAFNNYLLYFNIYGDFDGSSQKHIEENIEDYSTLMRAHKQGLGRYVEFNAMTLLYDVDNRPIKKLLVENKHSIKRGVLRHPVTYFKTDKLYFKPFITDLDNYFVIDISSRLFKGSNPEDFAIVPLSNVSQYQGFLNWNENPFEVKS